MLNINIFFEIVLLFAALFMGGLAMVTCMQVFRLRNKRISWRAGTLRGFPLFSSLFLIVSAVLSVTIWYLGTTREIMAAAFYLFFSASWFVSSYFSSKLYITDHGIVKNVSDPAQTIAWHQIHDFFEREYKNEHQYIFIYREQDEDALKSVVRLPLNIPAGKQADFKKLITHKLGRRISCYDETIDASHFK